MVWPIHRPTRKSGTGGQDPFPGSMAVPQNNEIPLSPKKGLAISQAERALNRAVLSRQGNRIFSLGIGLGGRGGIPAEFLGHQKFVRFHGLVPMDDLSTIGGHPSQDGT